jgi:hypothetical protein
MRLSLGSWFLKKKENANACRADAGECSTHRACYPINSAVEEENRQVWTTMAGRQKFVEVEFTKVLT